MSSEEKYLVYDPQSERLRFNNSESKLIHDLRYCPSYKLKKIIKDYLISQPSIAILRLKEILSIYWDNKLIEVDIFSYERGRLEKIIHLVEKQLSHNNGLSDVASKKNELEVDKEVEVVKLLIEFCKRNTSRNKLIAARTLIEAWHKYSGDKKVASAKIARFFDRNNILPKKEKITTLEHQFKESQLDEKNVRPNEPLYRELSELWIPK